MEGAKSYERRDRLIEIQNQAQEYWATNKSYEKEVDHNKPKFLITCPYPYANGRLHLGHAFTYSKAEFYARYKSMRGYNVLFPFAFHCTGMPISASANKLTKELKEIGVEGLKALIEKRKGQPEGKKDNMTQYEILLSVNVEEEQIEKFTDALFWLEYFPPRNKQDLTQFGVAVDWRRSFITTDVNPYYDSFIRWQFNTLKAKDFIKFGKRPSIFCIEDNQICAAHDRANSEDVVPQDYTLVKMKVADKSKACFDEFRDKEVFFLAATLRTETMYGQTNCYILPTGTYGAFEAKDGEVWICAERAAKNMAYQLMFPEENNWYMICEIKGEDLIGVPMNSPLCKYEQIYMWPMLTISMNKGTGIVTSVPSDSPDDFMNLQMLRNKPEWRAKWGLTDDMVMPFEPISIIDVPGYSDMSAEKACTDKKVKSPNDKAKLEEAKELCYQKGFYEGIMKVGEFTGKKVEEAKPLVRQMLLDSNQALKYYEPQEETISRSGYVCIVALCDQWYLDYGNEKYKEIIRKHINSEDYETFNPEILHQFEIA